MNVLTENAIHLPTRTVPDVLHIIEITRQTLSPVAPVGCSELKVLVRSRTRGRLPAVILSAQGKQRISEALVPVDPSNCSVTSNQQLFRVVWRMEAIGPAAEVSLGEFCRRHVLDILKPGFAGQCHYLGRREEANEGRAACSSAFCCSFHSGTHIGIHHFDRQ